MSTDLPTNYTVNGFFSLFESRQQSDNRSDIFSTIDMSCVIIIVYSSVLLRQREHQNRLLLKQLEMYTR